MESRDPSCLSQALSAASARSGNSLVPDRFGEPSGCNTSQGFHLARWREWIRKRFAALQRHLVAARHRPRIWGDENLGFTFVELMIALCIAGVLAAIALPSYRNYVIETRITGRAQFMAESIHMAQIQAIERYEPVTLCPSLSDSDCDGTSWQDGWIVFVDNGTPGTVDGDDEILRASQRYDDGVTLKVVAPANAGNNYILINPDKIISVHCDDCDAAQRTWVATMLSKISPISEAVAGPPANDGGPNNNNNSGNGGFQSGCSAEDASNNINSEKCNAPLGIFTFCAASHHGEFGREIRVWRWGALRLTKIRCG